MEGGIFQVEVDPADQLERIVALMMAHPLPFIGAVVCICLILGFQKDGLFSRIFGYLEKRAERDAALEFRRLEAISMIENRAQRELPGINEEDHRP